ncbi:MAG: prepilin-type N-terminal cleavage/methylation domain-containing protein, partial [Rhodococcus sp.]|nr:prepilin-type N-terminal cleavage/methylation domain-containing protein [Rhodococcus sp. (in: high G+C Gram-positive bacteria)]
MSEVGAAKPRDKGMTLPEVLIAVTMLGLIVAVLSSAVIVTLRQNDSTEGRFNVARAEQTIGMWLPADLASAEHVDNDPALTACPGEATADAPCPGMSIGAGSNALLVTWATLYDDDADAGTRTYDYTYISYYYSQDTDGTYKLTRIECTKRLTGDEPSGPGWACNSLPIVVGLPGPHPGWLPGDPVPEDVIAVTIPLDAAATDSSQVVVDGQNTKNARRVIVTVHGGGSSEGAGGGRNTISITAGGTYRTEIDAASMQGAPTFVEARSKCGGPLTLVIDESNSIPDINKVRDGVREFVKVLAGTPVRLQIVTFSDYARVLGTTTEWHRYFDLTNAAHVQELIGPPPHNSGGLVQQISYGGGGQSGVSSGSRTNWEDALYRSFRTSGGLVPQTIPKTLIFFTDGIPSRSRFSVTSDGRPYRSSLDTQNPLLPVTPPGWGDGFIPDPVPTNDYTHPYYTFNQLGFNRANYWANQA